MNCLATQNNNLGQLVREQSHSPDPDPRADTALELWATGNLFPLPNQTPSISR